MSKSNTTENDMLKAVLKGVDPAWRSNANRYLALHTADPGEAGAQNTSEAAYGSYARVAIANADWTDGGSVFSNSVLEQFPQCSSGTSNITHVSIGTLAAGAGQILYSGPLLTPLSVSTGIQPQFSPGAITVTED